MLQGLKKITFITFLFLVCSSIFAQEETLLDRANVFFQKGQYKNVVGLLAGEIEKYQENIQYHSLLGQSYFYLEKDEEAQRVLKKAIELDPKDFTCHYYLAGSYFYTSQYGLAKLEYEVCIKLDDMDPQPFYMLALISKEENRPVDQEKFLQSAVKLDAKNFNYVSAFANFYFMQKKYDKAKTNYQVCYQLDAMDYTTVSSLMQIAFHEDHAEEFKQYKAELKKIKFSSQDKNIKKLKHFQFDEYTEGEYTIRVCEIFKEEGEYYYYWIFYIYDKEDKCLGSVNLEFSIAMELAGLKYIIGADKYTDKGHQHKTTDIAFVSLPEYGKMKKYVAEDLTTGLSAGVTGTYED